MKRFIWIGILIVGMGCQDDSDVILNPTELMGTWRATAPEGRSWNRWTFHENDLYVSNDSIANCQPVEKNRAILWTYTTEKRAIVTTFAGPSASWTPTQIRWSIISSNPTHLVLTSTRRERLELEKCK